MHGKMIADLAFHFCLPAIGNYDFAKHGGLMVYDSPRTSTTSSSRAHRSMRRWCVISPAADAIAIARSCIRSGVRGRFYNVVDLVNRQQA
jgi:hypothetical protein